MPARTPKSLFLKSLIGSVALIAVLGIVLVVRSTWGWYEIRVMLTTITIAVASLCGLACDFSRTRRGANLLPIAGYVLTGVAALVIIIGIWTEAENEAFWKFAVTATIFAVATTHACLLSICHLARRFRWVMMVAYQVIFGLALLLATMMIGELDDESLFRLVAVVAIVDAALTLTIPILHRLSRSDNESPVLSHLDQRNVEAIDEEIARLRKEIDQLERLRAELNQAN